MACILYIETSTNVCSAALSQDGKILYSKESMEGPSHAALLGVFVEEAVRVMESKRLKPDAVAVSGGPGSYTGLRIGVSLAKGLCLGYGIPLLAVPTLEILALKAIRQVEEPEKYLFCPMLDARRMEVYAALYDAQLKPVREVEADIVTGGTYAPWLENGTVYFFGNGSDKCREVIHSPNALFLENIYPLAVDMIPLAERLFKEGTFEDAAYYDPFYLKDFVATVAKNKVLGDTNKRT